MKSNHIIKSLAFSEKKKKKKKKKIITSKYPLDQNFVSHFIKKTHVYYLKCRGTERETLIFLDAEKKITKVRKKKEDTSKKRQKKKKEEKKHLLSPS